MDDIRGHLRESLADRYSVGREIGRGGMATVFLAEEQHPTRKVAIKVLIPDVATRVVRERFLREVKVVSQLSHPYIVPVFAAGEAEGLPYFVMPYIDGESVRQRLARHGPLPIDEALTITREVASALHHAHEFGVIHRDVKPENILLTGGHALVADFGIARALGAAGGESLTLAGLAIGTPAYMSPEQALGRRDVDGRTDVYSLACVLLEMVTGTRPAVRTPQERLDLVETVHTVTGQKTVERLEAVLRRALGPDPDDRFSTALEFRDSLSDSELMDAVRPKGRRAVGIGAAVGGAAIALAAVIGALLPSRTGAATPERVVVALFENRTGDPELAPVGPMATDWITQGLAQTGILDVVVARAGLLDDGPDDAEPDDRALRALADETDAHIVVSGAYYRLGATLQFQPRITDPREGQVLIGLDPVSAPVDSPLVAVERLRQRVMGALASLTDDRLRPWAHVFTQPPSYDAYEAYVAGMTEFMRFNPPGAIPHFLRATALDSSFVSATLFAAFAHGSVEQWAEADSLAGWVNAHRNALSPLERHQLDWVTAMTRGDLTAALEAIREAAELTGREGSLLWGITALWANRPREALTALRDLDPQQGFLRDFFLYSSIVTGALHQLGDHREELARARSERRRFPQNRIVLENEIRALIALGQEAELDSLWDEFESYPHSPVLPRHRGDAMRVSALDAWAHGHRGLGDRLLQDALAWYRELSPREAGGEIHRYGLARTAYVAGEYAEAERLFRQLVRLRPDSLGYLGYLAAVHARQGRPSDARALMQSLPDFETPFSHGAISFWRARIASALGDYEEAVAHLRQAFEEGWKIRGDEEFNVDLLAMRGFEPFEALLRPKG